MPTAIINWPSEDHCPNLLGEVKERVQKKLGDFELHFREGPALQSAGGETLANTGGDALKFLGKLN